MRARAVAAASLLVILAGGGGCRKQQAPPEPPSFRVRLLTSAPISGRWERSAERGLGRIAAELGADVARLRADAEADRRRMVRVLGQQRVDLVFGVGPGVAASLFNEAPSFPATRFVVVPGAAMGEAVAGVEFLPEGAGYVAGVAAAMLRDQQVVGIVRGAGGAWLDDLEEGFVAGFRSRRPDAESVVAVPPEGPWEVAGRGAAVALYAADLVDPQVLAQAHDAGVLLVVANPDLLQEEPDVIAVAIRIDVAEAMVRLAREARDGTFRGGTYTFDLGSGVLDVVLNDSLPAAGDPALREAIERARSVVTAGIVEVERLGM